MEKNKRNNLEIPVDILKTYLKSKRQQTSKGKIRSSCPCKDSGSFYITLPSLESDKEIPFEVPISTVRINACRPNSKKKIFQNETKGEKDGGAKIYIAKGSKITKYIDHTNSIILQRHKNGEIDLSAEGL